MWVLVLVVMTSSVGGGTSSSISTVGNFSSELACLAAANDFVRERNGSLLHGADFVKEAHCFSSAEPLSAQPHRHRE
jgi:hypothetical protein